MFLDLHFSMLNLPGHRTILVLNLVTKLSIKSSFFQRHWNDDENESSSEVVDEHEGIEDDGDTVLRQID